MRTEFVEAPVFGGGRSDSLAVRGWLHDSSKIRHESLMARAEQRWAVRFGAADDRSL